MDTKAAFEKWLKEKMPNLYHMAFIAEEDEMTNHYKSSVFDMRTAWEAACTASRTAIETAPTKKLIGWRTTDYIEETTDPEKAKNWAMAVGVLLIFEGDVNTSLTTSHGIRIKGKTE